MGAPRRFSTFREFYPFYLCQHRNRACRRLHFIGTSCVVLLFALAIGLLNPWLLMLVLPVGYGFAWVGHLAFEKNKPATFGYPVYSLVADWVLWWEIATGKLRF